MCPRCATASTPALLSSRCPACETPIVRELGGEVRPGAVVPFAVDRRRASTALDRWAAARVSDAASMRATFLPAWVFDLETVTRYAGRRGDHYYQAETDGDGRSRQVRRTRWTAARGTVGRRFADVLVPGVRDLATRRLPAATVPFRAEYLSGVETPRYTVPPDQALDQAKTSVKPKVRAACLADVGGDDGRLHSVVTTYAAIDGDLVLLPYWTGTYLLDGRTWRFTVDGATGEVRGKRPSRAAGLTGPLVVLLLVVLAAVLVLVSR
ncbi:PepSY domain-containing protein [Herbidospora daliensis]|uniref:PepSY domain-containing protein n=1 Tax=Herbidospora daliensis TaxID=295585 RepID=UPI0012F8D0E2|nr:PepSY domain-containing protein [Herbidospora daliensis]